MEKTLSGAFPATSSRLKLEIARDRLAQCLVGSQTILATVTWTIVLSVIAHGLTANLLAARYGARADQRGGKL
jgi:NhaP-type Na+/H+ or K+/H+ antiporter